MCASGFLGSSRSRRPAFFFGHFLYILFWTYRLIVLVFYSCFHYFWHQQCSWRNAWKAINANGLCHLKIFKCDCFRFVRRSCHGMFRPCISTAYITDRNHLESDTVCSLQRFETRFFPFPLELTTNYNSNLWVTMAHLIISNIFVYIFGQCLEEPLPYLGYPGSRPAVSSAGSGRLLLTRLSSFAMLFSPISAAGLFPLHCHPKFPDSSLTAKQQAHLRVRSCCEKHSVRDRPKCRIFDPLSLREPRWVPRDVISQGPPLKVEAFVHIRTCKQRSTSYTLWTFEHVTPLTALDRVTRERIWCTERRSVLKSHSGS